MIVNESQDIAILLVRFMRKKLKTMPVSRDEWAYHAEKEVRSLFECLMVSEVIPRYKYYLSVSLGEITIDGDYDFMNILSKV